MSLLSASTILVLNEKVYSREPESKACFGNFQITNISYNDVSYDIIFLSSCVFLQNTTYGNLNLMWSLFTGCLLSNTHKSRH